MKEDKIDGIVTDCGKVGYLSLKHATTAMNTIKKHKRTAQNKIPKRSYYCTDCGFYHLTSHLKP